MRLFAQIRCEAGAIVAICLVFELVEGLAAVHSLAPYICFATNSATCRKWNSATGAFLLGDKHPVTLDYGCDNLARAGVERQLPKERIRTPAAMVVPGGSRGW